MPMSGMTSSCCTCPEEASRSCAMSVLLRGPLLDYTRGRITLRPRGEDGAVAVLGGQRVALLHSLLEHAGPEVGGQRPQTGLSSGFVQPVPERGVVQIGRTGQVGGADVQRVQGAVHRVRVHVRTVANLGEAGPAQELFDLGCSGPAFD